MAYVYIIKNDINDKVYIGKTNFSIEKRWKEHLQEASKHRVEHRPLYYAINKYGADHFYIEKLEECSVENSSDREIYWIEFYDSYKNGYNATLGGDGKTYLNYHKILKLFDETQLSQKDIANQCNCSVDSVRNIVNIYRDNVNWYERTNNSLKEKMIQSSVSVMCIEENKVFSSTMSACKWLMEKGKKKNVNGRTHISAVCKGKRKTAYGYHWKYV